MNARCKPGDRIVKETMVDRAMKNRRMKSLENSLTKILNKSMKKVHKNDLINRRVYCKFLCLLLMCVLFMNGCQRTQPGDGQGTDSTIELSEYTLNEFYFDTVISIKFDANEKGGELIKGCRKICDNIQMTFSRTDENSELYAINHRETDRVEVSEPLARLVQVGLDYYKISKGRFDITIAPLSDLWDFKSENPSVPSEAQIQSALRKVDARTVHVEGEGFTQRREVQEESELIPAQTESEMHTESETYVQSEACAESETCTESEVCTELEMHAESETQPRMHAGSETSAELELKTENKTDPGTGKQADTEAETETESLQSGWFLRFDSEDTMIDLGALVKGYAADRLAEYLKENGVTSGLINLGGNVYALGPKSDGSPWKVGIQKPFDTGVVETVEVTDKSVVSSGVYERCFEKDGVLYHHVLDPKTGYPVSNGLWGVSIISDSSLTGDALSTTCLAIGIHEAGDLIRSIDGVSAIFVDDQLHVTRIE